MARKDQRDDAAAGEDKSEPGQQADYIEEADGYRRSRRAKQLPVGAVKEEPKKAAEGGKQPSRYELFMEQHWEGWLSQVMLLVLLAVGYLSYTWNVLPEGMAGVLLAAAIVGGAIYATALPAMALIPGRRYQVLFGALCALWAFSSGFPSLRAAVQREALGQAVLTEAQKTAKVTIKEGTGPFGITISGKIKPSGTQYASANYEITVAGTNGSDTIEGDLEYQVHQTRSRKGSSHWTENHNQNFHRLSTAVTGHELTLSTDKIDDLLEDGLHVLVNPRGPDPSIFWGLAILVVLGMIFMEARVGDAKDKTHLVMASLVTSVFAYRYSTRATAANLVRPAVEALFVAAIIGGVGGTFLGWLVRRLSGRDKLRPRPDKSKRRPGDPDDE